MGGLYNTWTLIECIYTHVIIIITFKTLYYYNIMSVQMSYNYRRVNILTASPRSPVPPFSPCSPETPYNNYKQREIVLVNTFHFFDADILY